MLGLIDMVFIRRLWFFLWGCTVLCGIPVVEARVVGRNGCAGNLETVTGGPSDVLFHLLSLTGVKAKSWEGIIKSTAKWRISEEEKFQEELPFSEDVRDNIKDLQLFYHDLSLLNMTQVEAAAAARYDYAVIPGSILSVMRQRLRFLIGEWERGVRFDQIIFVTRSRKLYRWSEEPQHFIDPKHNQHPIKKGWDADRDGMVVRDENDIAPFIWGQMKLPQEWVQGSVKVVFLNADECQDCGPTCKFESLKRWIHTDGLKKKKTSILFIGSQPFIPLDSCRIFKIFGHSSNKISYDIVGPGFALKTLEQPWGVGVCLDVLSSWIEEAKGKGRFGSSF